MAKSVERLKARELRRSGRSIKEIEKELGVSRSSVSLWCRDIELTPEQKESLILRLHDGAMRGRLKAAEGRKLERRKRMARFEMLGKKKVGIITSRELFVVGTALYWAEGNKKQSRVVFANSDTHMVLLYLKWLKKCLGVTQENIGLYVGINEDHVNRIEKVHKYWSRLTGIPLKQFTKPSIKKVKNKKIYENFEDHYGTLFVRLRKSTNLSYEIGGYIEALRAAGYNSARG